MSAPSSAAGGKLRFVLCVAVVLGAIAAQAQRGALTYPRNLSQLTSQSSRIVLGRVSSATVERHPQLTHLRMVVVTIHVEEALKGPDDRFFTFRQFIWDVRDTRDAAGYAKGQRLLLLMNPPTRYGLSSPAGLGQGRFRVLSDAWGRQVAVNDRANRGLFESVGTELNSKKLQVHSRVEALLSRRAAGPVPLEDLRDLIKLMVSERAQ